MRITKLPVNLLVGYFFCVISLFAQTDNSGQGENDNSPVKKLKIINTDDRENNPIVSADGKIMFFNSTRKGTRAWATFDSLNNRYDEDIYFCKRLSNSLSEEVWSVPINLGSKINTKYDDGVVSVSPDCKKIYFTSVKKGWLLDDGPFYEAQLSDTQLTKIKGLGGGITMFFKNNTKSGDFNDDDPHSKRFRLYGASISADGKDFYFATTAGSEKGKHEIYVSHFIGKEWTYPQSLGSPINDSQFGDYAPFIAADGHTLFFASKRADGFGGDDIYVSINRDGVWQKPVNIGSPINSTANESFISMTASGENIYICSSRDQSDDIFTAPLSAILPPQYVVMLRGSVMDSLTERPLAARIIADETFSGDPLFNTSSDSKNGTYSVVLESGKNYTFTVVAPGYNMHSVAYQVPKNTTYRELMYNFKLSPISTTTSLDDFKPVAEEIEQNDPRAKEDYDDEVEDEEPTAKQIQLRGNITEKKTNKPLQAFVTLTDKNSGDTLGFTRASRNGNYKINLDQGVEYMINVSEPKHVPSSIPYSVPEVIYRKRVTSDFQLDKLEDAPSSIVETLKKDREEQLKNPKKNRAAKTASKSKYDNLDLRNLSGIVTDKTNGVPVMARVALFEKKSNNQAAESSALADGVYNLELLPGVSYNIVVQADGYQPEMKSFKIPKSSTNYNFTYNFSLNKLEQMKITKDAIEKSVVEQTNSTPNSSSNFEVLYDKNKQQNNDDDIAESRPFMSFGGKDVDVNPLYINLNAPFGYGTAAVNPILYPQLDSLIKMMKADPNMRIQIGGHTDNVGSASYNKYLSSLRADAVKIYLIEKGQLAPNRIKTKGFGFDQPIESNGNEEGRTKNRRVEIKMLKNRVYKRNRIVFNR